MDTKSLNIFVDVMRRGSYASVARDRNVDPSSISRSIATLEDELGVRLFHRTTRRLSPTEAGLLYFDRVEPLVEELEEARLLALDSSAKPQGRLRIAAPVSFSQLNITPLLPGLAAQYPDLSFDLVLTDAAIDLLEEKIDIAIRLGPIKESGYIARRLSPMIARVCASPSYIRVKGKPAHPTDLVQHNCLLLNMPSFTDQWQFIAQDGESTAVSVQGQLVTSNAVALKQCALQGMGIILQARWIVGRELSEGTLVDLFPDYDVSAASFEHPAIWLLYPTRTYVPLKVKVFVDYLQAHFKDTPPWDSPGL